MRKNIQETEMEAMEQETAANISQETVQNGRAGEDDFITFELFRDSDKYRGDKFVGVNGRSYLIKRGVPVRMPRAVYEVLKNSNEQLMCAEKYMENAKNVEIKVD